MRASNDDVWTLDEDPVHIETIEQLLARPRYVAAGKIDLRSDPIRAVIGWYYPLSVECALPDGTPHLKGYLCRTASGAEVCVGHICGAQHLGDEFQQMINVMNKRAELLRDRAIIGQALGRREIIRARLQELCDGPHGGAWLARNQATLARLPASIYANLRQRAEKNNGVIREERRLTEEEKARLEVMRTGLASAAGHGFDDWKKVGELIGLGAVKRSIEAAFDDVETQLLVLEATVDNLSVKDYRRWANWCKSIDGRVEAIELLILEGRRFFSEANIRQLRLLPSDTSARSRLDSLRFEYYEEPGKCAA